MKTNKEHAKGAKIKTNDEMMSGSDILVAALEREGVETIFAYPGGSSMLLHQALTRSKKLRTVLPRHEQGGAFMAGGYARASGKVGVCMATSGPGATNLLTGIADAYMDSIPVVAITGQVPTSMIGKNSFQETAILGMTMPIVKHSYLVLDAKDLPYIVKEAFYIASRGRKGPVLIDIPKNVQMGICKPVWPEKIQVRPCNEVSYASDEELAKVIELIQKSERPVLYVGGGIISADASEELKKFALATNIPVTTTLMGIGCFPENHSLSLKWLGMHGTWYANHAVDRCDLLITMGARFDDRVTGDVNEFAKRATIVHIDVDESELNKNKKVQFPILSDIHHALKRLNQMLAGKKPNIHAFAEWHAQIEKWKKQYPLTYRRQQGKILPQQVIETFNEINKGKCIVATGVGQHQMWTAQFCKFDQPRTLLTSAGLGAMGFGLPTAVGAKVAMPDQQVVDIDGDGSFLMNVQELGTIAVEKIPVKVIILNNQYLGMVMQWEDRFFASNRGHTYLGKPKDRQAIYPDYPTICKGFEIPCERVSEPKDLKPAIQRMLTAKTAYVLDVIVPYTEHVLPMIPAGKTVRDIMIDPMF
ncbi:MAG: biosynthetic-type acetolactate synthase large subunit [Verrucomicrobiota bacterium]